MRVRSVIIGCVLFATGTVVGVSTHQLASATISSGDRAVLVPIDPCRLTDTRADAPDAGPRSSPLGAGETITLDAQQAGVPCSGLLPTAATALALNVTALNATEQTFLTVWADGARPDSSSRNPAPEQPPAPNAVTTRLSASNDFRIFNSAGSVDVIVDVVGYYEDHDHDDRYSTRAELDLRIADQKAIALENPTGLFDGEYDIRLTLIVPADYTPGTTPRFEVHLRPGLDAPCVVQLQEDFVWGSTPGEVSSKAFGVGLIDVIAPTDLEFDFTGANSIVTQLLEFTVDVGDVLQPGDSLSVGFFERISTTCTNGGILGATFFYE